MYNHVRLQFYPHTTKYFPCQSDFSNHFIDFKSVIPGNDQYIFSTRIWPTSRTPYHQRSQLVKLWRCVVEVLSTKNRATSSSHPWVVVQTMQTESFSKTLQNFEQLFLKTRNKMHCIGQMLRLFQQLKLHNTETQNAPQEFAWQSYPWTSMAH